MKRIDIDDPLVASLVKALLDSADRRAPEVRVMPPRITLDARTCPEWFSAEGREKQYSWRRVQDLVSAELISLPVKIGRYEAPWRERPSITLTAQGERWLREWTGRAFPEASSQKLWRTAVSAREDIPDPLRQALLNRPIVIGRRDAGSVLDRLIWAAATFGRSTKRRVVSAKTFWGMSKVLDHRDDLIRQIGGQPEQLWQRRALLMHVHAPVPVPQGILFIENLDAFDAVCQGDVPVPSSWWVLFAAGFKGSSQRLFFPGGVRWFTEAGTTKLAPETLQEGLNRAAQGDCESAFWGDLDFAGMQILRQIRRSIPATVAWRPGYGKLLSLMEAGAFHDPDESTKSGQADPGSTGCDYCDQLLLPAMRKRRGFVDQEAACHPDDWASHVPFQPI